MWQAHDMFVDMFLPSWVTRFQHRRTMIGYLLYLGTHLPPKSSVLTWAQFSRRKLFTGHTLALADGRKAGVNAEITSYGMYMFLYPWVSIMQLGSNKFSNNLAVFPSWKTWEELHAVWAPPPLSSSLFYSTVFSHPLLFLSKVSFSCLSCSPCFLEGTALQVRATSRILASHDFCPPLLPSHRISRIESRLLWRARAGTVYSLGSFTAARSSFMLKKICSLIC